MKEGEESYYYKYKVNENNGTYSLIQSFKVPYSAYVSSAQEYKGNIIIDSLVCREFSENMTHRGISFKNLRWNLPMNIFTVYISMILRTSILKSSRNIWRDFK